MELTVALGAIGACLAGGILPWINSELAVVAAAVVIPESSVPALVVGCTVAQMSAKSGLYVVTRWTPHRLPRRARRLLGRAEKYRDRRRLLVVAVFSSALASVPPFYLVTLACGVVRMPYALFAAAGLAGVGIRYGLISWLALTVSL